MDRDKILKHLNDNDEKLAFAKVVDCFQQSLKQRRQVFTDFLDCGKTAKFNDILSHIYKEEVNMAIFGGFCHAERKVIGFSPNFISIIDGDFPIKSINIEYNMKYGRMLSHRDYLGSILALGINRGNVGDIILGNGRATVFLLEKIATYVETNLMKIGSTKVSLSFDNENTEVLSDNNGKQKNITVSSLRIDSIISSAVGVSRSKAKALIEGDKIFANWSLVSSCSKMVNKGDILTIRGIGRIQVYDICGKTKKDRIMVHVVVYSS